MTREVEIDDDGNEVPKGDLVKTSSKAKKRAKNLTFPSKSKNPPLKRPPANGKKGPGQKHRPRGPPPRRANDGADSSVGTSSKTSTSDVRLGAHERAVQARMVEARMKRDPSIDQQHKWKVVRSSMREITQVGAAQTSPKVEASDSSYGRIYLSIRRATETRRPGDGRQNQNPEWSEGEDGRQRSPHGGGGGGGSEGLVDIETIIRSIVGKPELSLEEKDDNAESTWLKLDPDGLGVVAVHKLAWLVRQTWPELHREDLYVTCFRTVVAKIEQKDRQSVTADRRTWVERKYFVKLLCTIIYFRKLLGMHEARSGPSTSRDKAMLVEFREFQYMMKRLGIKASDAEIKSWFNAGHSSEVATVRLDELAYGLALRRFFPEAGVAHSYSQHELSKVARAKARRARNVSYRRIVSHPIPS